MINSSLVKVISSSNAQGLRNTYMGDIISWMFYYTTLVSEFSAKSSPLTNFHGKDMFDKLKKNQLILVF